MIPENRRQEAARSKSRTADDRSRLQGQLLVLAVGLSALLVLLLF